MNKIQAAAVQKHALTILDAVAKIEAIVQQCGKIERAEFADSIGDVVVAARFGLLQPIYREFPDLRVNDKEEPPTVSSDLEWPDVTLPTSFSAADLDEIILSTLKPSWRKTARVIFEVTAACKERLTPIAEELVGARIRELAKQRRVEAKGDLSMWRHSEVRLLAIC